MHLRRCERQHALSKRAFLLAVATATTLGDAHTVLAEEAGGSNEISTFSDSMDALLVRCSCLLTAAFDLRRTCLLLAPPILGLERRTGPSISKTTVSRLV